MAMMEREKYIELRVAEGWTKEAAAKDYDVLAGKLPIVDPEVKAAMEQKVPTKADMMVMINEAIQNNPNRKKVYTPNFKYSTRYEALKKELDKLNREGNAKEAEAVSKKLLSIQISGTLDKDTLDAEVDKTLNMSIDALFKEYHRLEKIIKDCEYKIDDFDVSKVQAEADALEAQYKRKAKGVNRAYAIQEYHKAVDDLEFEKITKPLNDLKIKRWEAMQYFTIYKARIDFFMTSNKEAIDAEIAEAKREEIRHSLADIVSYRGEDN